MNERIKELSAVARHWAHFDGLTQNPTSSPDILFEQKFAELIVKECIKKVELRKEFAIEDEHNVDEAFSLLVYDIEEYFGVDR